MLLFAISCAFADDIKPVKPFPEEKCPVCGMFVAKFPSFAAQIVFKDGSRACFDGSKDMFKYYFNMKKYDPSRNSTDITAIFVTDYYNLVPIDGLKAQYVVGSNVFGPMGRELIPFENEADAKQFMADHAGKSLLQFNAVTGDLIKELD